jgi:hypothetical protein
MNYFIVAFNGSVARLTHVGGLSEDLETAKQEIREAFHVHFPNAFFNKEVVKISVYPLPDPDISYVFGGQDLSKVAGKEKELLEGRCRYVMNSLPNCDLRQHYEAILYWLEQFEEDKKKLIEKREDIPAAVVIPKERKEIVLRKFEEEPKDE